MAYDKYKELSDRLTKDKDKIYCVIRVCSQRCEIMEYSIAEKTGKKILYTSVLDD